MTAERLVSPRKIAVLHAQALGDLIMTLPALTAVKQTYPGADLILLTSPWTKEFLSGRPSPIDKAIVIPPLPDPTDTNRPKSSLRNDAGLALDSPQLEHFFDTMRAEKFDVVLHMQGDGTIANPFINRLGAKLTAGMNSTSPEPPDRSIPYVHYQSEIIRHLEIVKLIGAYTDDLEPHLETTIKDNREIADLLESFGGAPFIVLHPGADDMRRLWPSVKFAAVADTFTKRGYQVVITGTPKEKPLITEIIQYMQYTALAQTSLTIGGLAALLSRASLVIGNDTGPLHLARAVGTRTVGIYWVASLLNRGPLFRRKHRIAISWQLDCPKCGVKPVSPRPFLPISSTCDHPRSFVESVPISEVITLASELLGHADSSDT